jgi:hypothetical protein
LRLVVSGDGRAADSTEPRFETPDGLKTAISDLIAEPLGGLVGAVQAGFYGDRALDVNLIRDSHSAFLGDVVPGIAAR